MTSTDRQRRAAAISVLVGLVLIAQLGTLALAGPIAEGFTQDGQGNIATDENSESADTTSQVETALTLVAGLLTVTLLALAAIKMQWNMRTVGRAAVLLVAAFYMLFPLSVVGWLVQVLVPGAGAQLALLAIVGSSFGLATYALRRPNWANLTAIGVLLSMAAAALAAVELGILGALLVLVVLAVYDALSVYVSEHMVDLASAGVDADLPILLQVPYGDGDGNAAMLGLGDVVVPGVLIAAGTVRFGLVVGAATLVGTMAGLVAVQLLAARESVHAGLPPLNGGALAGYLLAALGTGVAVDEMLGVAGLDVNALVTPATGTLVVVIGVSAAGLALYSRRRNSTEVHS